MRVFNEVKLWNIAKCITRNCWCSSPAAFAFPLVCTSFSFLFFQVPTRAHSAKELNGKSLLFPFNFSFLDFYAAELENIFIQCICVWVPFPLPKAFTRLYIIDRPSYAYFRNLSSIYAISELLLSRLALWEFLQESGVVCNSIRLTLRNLRFGSNGRVVSLSGFWEHSTSK